MAQIAASENRDVATIDIACAYLNAYMPTDDPAKLVHMTITQEVSQIMCELDNSFLPFKEPDDTLIVVLKRALYGCVKSALLWFKELTSFLSSIGFAPNNCDPCVMNKETGTSQITIGIYADDLIITSSDK